MWPTAIRLGWQERYIRSRIWPGLRRRMIVRLLFFFFQAEDGIRDIGVTGVQTCALPIYPTRTAFAGVPANGRPGFGDNRLVVGTPAKAVRVGSDVSRDASNPVTRVRSEERRVGKEGRSRWSPDH